MLRRDNKDTIRQVLSYSVGAYLSLAGFIVLASPIIASSWLISHMTSGPKFKKGQCIRDAGESVWNNPGLSIYKIKDVHNDQYLVMWEIGVNTYNERSMEVQYIDQNFEKVPCPANF